MALVKLAKEHRSMIKSPNELFTAGPKVVKTLSANGQIIDDIDYFVWDCIIRGPVGSHYEGGKFHVTITCTENYPFKPPTAVFKTRIHHPNISATGLVCIDILKHNWSPVFNIEKILLAISSILAAPNPDDPLEPSIGIQMRDDPEGFAKMARDHTRLYS